MKKKVIKIFCFAIFLLLIFVLSIPCFADTADFKEKVSDDRLVGNIYYEYSFNDARISDRGNNLSGEYDLSLGASIDLFIGGGNYVPLSPSNRSTFTDGYFEYQAVFDYAVNSAYVYNGSYTYLDYVTLAFSQIDSYLLIGVPGIYFYNGDGILIFDRLAFRVYYEGAYIYLGCTDTDFSNAIPATDFYDYCISFASPDYGTGLFVWIEEHFLPLFGDVPTDVLDMGIFGSWSALQFIRVVMWVTLGLVCCSAFVILPYCIIRRLLGIKKRGVKK